MPAITSSPIRAQTSTTMIPKSYLEKEAIVQVGLEHGLRGSAGLGKTNLNEIGRLNCVGPVEANGVNDHTGSSVQIGEKNLSANGYVELNRQIITNKLSLLVSSPTSSRPEVNLGNGSCLRKRK